MCQLIMMPTFWLLLIGGFCELGPNMASSTTIRSKNRRHLKELFPVEGSIHQDLLIRYRNQDGRFKILDCLLANGSETDKADLLAKHINVIPARLSRNQTRDLLDDPDIEDIELDSPIYLQGEMRPYALSFIQALSSQNTLPSSATASNACYNESSFKIAILDSGVDASHPDLDCLDDGSCIGQSFGRATSMSWSDATDDHGTMIAGIIASKRNNDKGIKGVVENVCLLIGRIFVSDQDEGRLSDMLAAVAWAADSGARVINLSLGSPYTSLIGRVLFDNLYERENVLVIAAAGNDGTDEPMYPASYDSVISVGAVTPQLETALFSQHNPYIDLVTPGLGLLSTAREQQSDSSIYAIEGFDPRNRLAIASIHMGHSARPDKVQGHLVHCSSFGTSICEGDGGHICLVGRGENLYYQKAINCQLSGGIGAIIYDSEPGPPLNSTLGSLAENVSIPVVGISQNDGKMLIEEFLGRIIGFRQATDLRMADGTSFCAPYVSGAMAAVWQVCHNCSNFIIRQCFTDTAMDLGEKGKDDYFGFGLVQVEAAYQCALKHSCCSTTTPQSSRMPTPTTRPSSLMPSVSTIFPGELPYPFHNSTLSTVCPAEISQYTKCAVSYGLSESLNISSTCTACTFRYIQGAIDGNYTCESMRKRLCKAAEQCACSMCSVELDRLVSCASSLRACILHCNEEPSTSPETTSPSGDATTLPPSQSDDTSGTSLLRVQYLAPWTTTLLYYL